MELTIPNIPAMELSPSGNLSAIREQNTLSENISQFTDVYQIPHFFYLGHKTEKINKIVAVLKKGYAAESIEDALSVLSRFVASNDKSQIPAVIIIDDTAQLHTIQKLKNFLNRHEQLRSIPIVLDTQELDKEKLLYLKKCKYFDDIINLDVVGEKIKDRIALLQKIKDQKQRNTFQQNIETRAQFIIDYNHLMKRCFDILMSITALIALSPLFLLLAIAIKFDSHGPVFYISKRAGKGYRIFNFYKFRTMEVDADKKIDSLQHLNQYNATTNNSNAPVFFKINNDPRISKIGSFLRNTSLDELPQLINVLLGDMSLVGNRPLPLYEASTLTTSRFAARFMAPAGITGLWQIKKRGNSNMSIEERIDLDISYANKNNFVYDLWIMANTPTAVFQKSNV